MYTIIGVLLVSLYFMFEKNIIIIIIYFLKMMKVVFFYWLFMEIKIVERFLNRNRILNFLFNNLLIKIFKIY